MKKVTKIYIILKTLNVFAKYVCLSSLNKFGWSHKEKCYLSNKQKHMFLKVKPEKQLARNNFLAFGFYRKKLTNSLW